MKEITMYFYY